MLQQIDFFLIECEEGTKRGIDKARAVLMCISVRCGAMCYVLKRLCAVLVAFTNRQCLWHSTEKCCTNIVAFVLQLWLWLASGCVCVYERVWRRLWCDDMMKLSACHELVTKSINIIVAPIRFKVIWIELKSLYPIHDTSTTAHWWSVIGIQLFVVDSLTTTTENTFRMEIWCNAARIIAYSPNNNKNNGTEH